MTKPRSRLVHEVLQPADWQPPKGYANGVLARGQLIFTGGVIGWDADGILADGFINQTRQVLENICAILAEADAGPQHLTRLTWYVVDINEYLADQKALGEAYRSVMGYHFPAMATVEVSRLVEPSARVEIEATAVLPEV